MYVLERMIGTKLKTLRLCTIARLYAVTKIHELSHRYWLLFFVHDQSNICSLPLVLCALRPVLFFFVLLFDVCYNLQSRSRVTHFLIQICVMQNTCALILQKTQSYPFSCVHFFKTFKYDLYLSAF